MKLLHVLVVMTMLASAKQTTDPPEDLKISCLKDVETGECHAMKEPALSQATTYAMLNYETTLTCTGTTRQGELPSSVLLKKDGSAVGKGGIVKEGESGAWSAAFYFTPTASGDFGPYYTCHETTVYGTYVSKTYALSEVVMTMTDKETTGSAVTLTCDITVAAAPTSVKWYTEVTRSDSEYTVTTSTYSDKSGHIISTLLVYETITADATYTCIVSFGSGVSSYEIASSAAIDHVVMTAPNMHTLEASVTLTCTVSAANSGATITWSRSPTGTPALVNDNDYSIATAAASTYTDTKTGLVSTLGVLSTAIAADATYYCFAAFSSGTSISKTSILDHVFISGIGRTSAKASVTLTCVLSDSYASIIESDYWTQGGSTPLTVTGSITAIVEGSYSNTGYTTTMTVTPTVDIAYTCMFKYDAAGNDIVTAVVNVDFFTPRLSRAITYGMKGKDMVFTCLIDSEAQPTSVSLIKASTAQGSAVTSGFGGVAGAWTSLLTYSVPTDFTFADTFGCIATVDSVTSTDSGRTVQVEEVTMTMTSRVTIGSTSETLSCNVGVSDAPVSVKWYNPSSTEVTSSTSGYTVTTSAYSTPSGHIMSTLLVDASITADATYTCKVSFDSGANSYEIASTAYIELISLNPVDTATVGGSGSSATVTCSLTDSGKTYDSFGWYDSTGNAVVTAGPVTVNVPVYSSGSVATLVVSEPTVDVSYTCKVKYQSDGSNDLTETAIIDLMVITPTSTNSVGSAATVSCVLSGSSWAAIASVEWTHNGGAALTSSDSTITSVTTTGDTTVLVATAPTADITYTCSYKFATDGSLFDKVFSLATIDHVAPRLSRAITYGMKGKDMVFTCTIDSEAQPTSVSLTKASTAQGSAVTNGFGGLAGAWTSLLTYSVPAGYTFADTFGCIATVDTGTSTDSGRTVQVEEVTMTMTSRVTTGSTSETLTCNVGVSGAPVSVKWYDTTPTEITASTASYTYIGGSHSSNSQISTLEVGSTIITIDAAFTCKVSFDNSNEYFYESTAYIEVITMIAVDAATVGGVGSSATVSCKVDGSSDKEWDSIKWYNGAGEISSSPFTVTDPSSFAADSTSTLATSEPTADATYTCTVKYQSDGTNDISVSVVLDFVVITETGATSSGAPTVISCVLSQSLSATASVKWTQASSTALAASDDTITAVNTPGYASNGQTTALTITSPSADITYTCNFVYSDPTNIVYSDVVVDYFEPVLSRAITYAMLDYETPFTCTVDSTEKPTSTQLKKGGSALGSAVNSGALTGSSGAWVATFSFTPTTRGDFGPVYTCETTVEGTTDVSATYTLSEAVHFSYDLPVLHSSDIPYRHVITRGVPVPGFVNENRMRDVEGFRFQENDIVVASYQKAGSIILRVMVQLLLGLTAEEDAFHWIEVDGVSVGERSKVAGFRLLRTHIPFTWLPDSKSRAKFLFLYPLDEDFLLSLYSHFYVSDQIGFTGDWDTFLRLWTTNKVFYGSFYSHVDSWITGTKTCQTLLWALSRDQVTFERVKEVYDFIFSQPACPANSSRLIKNESRVSKLVKVERVYNFLQTNNPSTKWRGKAERLLLEGGLAVLKDGDRKKIQGTRDAWRHLFNQ